MFARHAASLIVWRQAQGGTEVLMGSRAAAHRFMPNRLVFPGGAVDEADAAAAVAREPPPDTLAMLQRNASPKLARALAVAAVRELEEEVGLTLGRPPDLHQLTYLCRAVTPPSSPIRFNARFLVLPAEAARGTASDSGELNTVGYYKVEEALGLGLMEVTREVLRRLLAYVASPAAERDLVVYKQRRWVPDVKRRLR